MIGRQSWDDMNKDNSWGVRTVGAKLGARVASLGYSELPEQGNRWEIPSKTK